MTAEATTANEIRLRVFGRTDVGQIREHNEDNFLIADLTRKSRSLMEADRDQVVGPRGTVLGVCDGMGGAAAGEVASQLAVDIIYEKLVQGQPNDHNELARGLVRAVEDAGARIFSEAPSTDGSLATTLRCECARQVASPTGCARWRDSRHLMICG